jgi:hypothetical protein
MEEDKMLTEARMIFFNKEAPLHRRIEAAALVLRHNASSDLIEDATAFLEAVAQNDGPGMEGYRLDAIEALAKRQVPKAGTPGPGQYEGDRRKAWQQHAAAERRKALMKAGEWPAPKGWADDIYSEDWIAPEGDPPFFNINPVGLANDLGAARKAFLEEKIAKLGLVKVPKDE